MDSFYWKIRHLYDETIQGIRPPLIEITGQMMWREYFYTQSRLNLHFNQIKDNPVCLNIPWSKDESFLQDWKDGKTGYPFIDAGMRQIVQEGLSENHLRSH